MAKVQPSTQKAEKIILIVMGIILAVSLVVLFKRDTSSNTTKKDPSTITLPDHDHEAETPEANVAQPEEQ